MSSAGTGAAGTSVGLQIGLAALANVLTSSSMAVFNAWIFRAGYHFQFSLIVVQQIVCTLFALAQVTYLPGEKQKLRISGRRYFTMLLPFSAIVAAKLYIQNKAFEYVSPAFDAMIASTLPVGVTALAIVRKIEPFRLSTVVAAALVSVGGVMIKAGEVRLSGVGFVLTASALLLDVVRLVLMQYLVQPLLRAEPVRRAERRLFPQQVDVSVHRVWSGLDGVGDAPQFVVLVPRARECVWFVSQEGCIVGEVVVPGG